MRVRSASASASRSEGGGDDGGGVGVGVVGGRLGPIRFENMRCVGARSLPAARRHGTLDRCLELAHVARPVVVVEAREERRRHLGSVLALCLCRFDELQGERDDHPAAFAERRNRQRDAVEPVVQIRAKPPRGDFFGEIAVRRGDEANVDLDRRHGTDARDLTDLDRAQQLRLQRRRQLADLVEKHGAAVGCLEQTGLGPDRAGERALLVAEQLALEERLGERGAVDPQKRTAPARQLVHRLRQHLLADAGLAEDQHAGTALGDVLDDRGHAIARRILDPDDLADRARRALAGMVVEDHERERPDMEALAERQRHGIAGNAELSGDASPVRRAEVLHGQRRPE